MEYSRTITLFYQPSELRQRPNSFLVSMLVHGLVVALSSYVIMNASVIKDPIRTHRYITRRLEFRQAEPHTLQTSRHGADSPGWNSTLYPSSTGVRTALQPARLGQISRLTPGLQTLVQPEISPHLTLAEEIPIPTMVIWTPKKSSVKVIVPPPPQRPSAVDVTTSLEPPNEEINGGDISVSSSELSLRPNAILPSTTSPITMSGPDPAHSIPATTLQLSADPTPVAVMALSDLHMAEGNLALPPTNQTVRAESSGVPANKRPGNGGPAEAAGSRRQSEATIVVGQKSDPEFGAREGFSADRISLPKDGQFEAVVVGSSLEEEYPETAELWTGRLAYTVYLHVGLQKSWILQYSLPRSAEAREGGSGTRIHAPWPFIMVRPNIPPDEIDADALMVHGFVNEAGRFEGLAIAFPPDFPHGQYVLDALQQWQFRPAIQNGQTATVEVLVIIPGDQQ